MAWPRRPFAQPQVWPRCKRSTAALTAQIALTVIGAQFGSSSDWRCSHTYACAHGLAAYQVSHFFEHQQLDLGIPDVYLELQQLSSSSKNQLKTVSSSSSQPRSSLLSFSRQAGQVSLDLFALHLTDTSSIHGLCGDIWLIALFFKSKRRGLSKHRFIHA